MAINHSMKKILKALSFDGIEVEAARHLASLKAIDPMKIFHKTIDYKIYNGDYEVPVRIYLPREKVTEDLIRHYNAHPELSDAAREYIYKKTEGVILSYYVAGCIMNPDKTKGRKDCLRYNAMIQKLNMEFWNRVSKKFKMYLWMNRFGITFPVYEKMLHSEIYNRLRHNQKIESEK